MIQVWQRHGAWPGRSGAYVALISPHRAGVETVIYPVQVAPTALAGSIY